MNLKATQGQMLPTYDMKVASWLQQDLLMSQPGSFHSFLKKIFWRSYFSSPIYFSTCISKCCINQQKQATENVSLYQNTLLRIDVKYFLIQQDQWNKHNTSFTEQSCSDSTLSSESYRIETLSLA